jgi:hypothetical protein
MTTLSLSDPVMSRPQPATNPEQQPMFRADLSAQTEPQGPMPAERGGSSRCNVGHTEQKLRLAAGTALLATAAFAPLSRGWRIGLATLAVAELATGAARYCPVSQLLGINTCEDQEP